jgi:hypothetical protein
MFGMEKIATNCGKDKEKKLEKKALLEAFIEKEAKDHYHVDSEGQKTSPSIHEGGEEENPHKHKLKDGGETDKKESGKQHRHKEKDEDGGKTGPAIKTASSREEHAFIEGFMKSAGFSPKTIAKAIKSRAKKVGVPFGAGDEAVTVSSLKEHAKQYSKSHGAKAGKDIADRATVARAQAMLPKKGPKMDLEKAIKAEGEAGARYGKSALGKKNIEGSKLKRFLGIKSQ